MIACQRIVESLEQLAPKYLAESWDNVGLLIGNPRVSVNKILVCLDIDERVVDQAISSGANMIISHHPFMFNAIKRIDTSTTFGRSLQKIMQFNIQILCLHTNLDTAWGGLNDVVADKLHLENIEPLMISQRERILKLGVNVPVEYKKQVQEAISTAGGGHIGDYSDCFFAIQGTGCFKPNDQAKPFLGKANQLELVEECRLETVFPESLERKIIKAIHRAHPYEEPAYDIVETTRFINENGLGRIGYLPVVMSLSETVEMIKEILPGNNFRLVRGSKDTVRKIAICTGAGASFINKAAFAGADLYITGDVKYHEAQMAQALGLNVLDAGHFGTEYPIVEVLTKYLQDIGRTENWDLEVLADMDAQDVFETI